MQTHLGRERCCENPDWKIWGIVIYLAKGLGLESNVLHPRIPFTQLYGFVIESFYVVLVVIDRNGTYELDLA